MIKTHLYTREEKLQWFGYGIWCDEPDEVKFEWADMECWIRRLLVFEISGHAFGGHLCGYVKIPEIHPLFENEKGYDLDLDIHGGITFNDHFHDDDKTWWIGFDCAHSMDVIPSTIEMRKKINDEMKEKYSAILNSHTNCAIFNSSYKTVDFLIEECKKLAEQLALIKV